MSLLLLLCVTPCYAVADGNNTNKSEGLLKEVQVDSLFNKILGGGRMAENLNEMMSASLPVGIQKTMGNVTVTLAVSKVRFASNNSEMDLYAMAQLPYGDDKKPKRLYFGATHVPCSNKGSIVGEVQLTLLQDYEIPFGTKNDGSSVTLVLNGGTLDKKTGDIKATKGCSISFDCDGFKNLQLEADVKFPKTLIQQVDATKGTLNGKQVVGHFNTSVSDWNDIVASVNLPAFGFVSCKPLDGFVFNLNQVVFDFSETKNADAMQFPKSYSDEYLADTDLELWKGVYAKEVKVTLPPAFCSKDSARTSFMASDMLIDDNGITGMFSGKNILPFDKGSASGWNFSVDSLGLELKANHFISADFKGGLGLPFHTPNRRNSTNKTDSIGKNSSRLAYIGNINSEGRYYLQIENLDSLDFSLFHAKATLLENSYVAMTVEDGKFRPEAMLHGRLSITKSKDDGNACALSVPTLEFRSLHIQTVAPYISVDSVTYSGGVSLGKFPISLSNIRIDAPNDEAVLSADISANIGDSIFAAKSNIGVKARLQQDEGSDRKKWRYDGLVINDIDVSAKITKLVTLSGKLKFLDDDPVYGDGFSGSIEVAVKPTEKAEALKVKSTACFGHVDGYHYWFTEGSVQLSNWITIYGPFKLSGFGGGLSYHMRRETGSGEVNNPYSVSGSSGIKTAVNYVPDNTKTLGIKASVMFCVGEANKAVAGGEGLFELAFSSSGGLAYAGIYGYAEFPRGGGFKNVNNGLKDGMSAAYDKKVEASYKAMAQKDNVAETTEGLAKLKAKKANNPLDAAKMIKALPDSIKIGLRAVAGITMDFDKGSFHAAFETYLNAADGLLEGVGENGKCGSGVMHIDKSTWYIHLGTPKNRLGVKMGIGSVNIQADAYFMAGHDIPEMPEPPKELADILKTDLSKLKANRDTEVLQKGSGLIFGSSFKFDTGDLRFLILYAKFSAGIGFDVLLKDYNDMQCKGREGRIGLNGWYAQGQTYAYLSGEVGVKVKILFINKKFPVLKGSAGCLLQAGLPNPSYFKGYLGLNVNVLGIIKGHMNFKLSFGEVCDFVNPGDSPVDMPMINDVSPANGEEQVSVFAMPQVTFNQAIGKQFSANDDDGTSKTYRINLKDFSLTDSITGKKVEGTLVWNNEKNAVTFKSHEVLPEFTRIKMAVCVGFEEFKNGRWEIVKSSGKEAYEKREVGFNTGGAPDEIPLNNVIYTYPVVDQHYMLRSESRNGYVQLNTGQKYLFEKERDYKLRFTTDNNSVVEIPFKYDNVRQRLEYTIPELQLSKAYTMSISYVPDATDVAANKVNSMNIVSDSLNSVSIEKLSAAAGVNGSVEKNILIFNFGTSRFSTFKEKMESLDQGEMTGVKYDDEYLPQLFFYVNGVESFDSAEVVGIDKSKCIPLIKAKATLDEPFFTEKVMPIVYDGYPFNGVRLKKRDENPIGVPPYYSVQPSNVYVSDLSIKKVTNKFRFPFIYNTYIYVMKDLGDLRSQVVDKYSVNTDVYKRFVLNNLKFMEDGYYKAIFTYILPDGSEGTSYMFKFEKF
ncbi:MAG: hypothetical protein J6M59_13525 [Bacteroidaceae bacterium]|nr:hypothetical protein [Bacteroidaceae bacterium]